jgi:hypothetical protein
LKKQANTNINDTEQVFEELDLDNIFHFKDEEACFVNQWIDEKEKIPYIRQKPPEQVPWDLFKEKTIDPKTQKYYTNGEGTGKCLGKEGPKRYVTTIIRMKASNGAEYLLSNSKIIGYNAFGDKVETSANLPEKYQKTSFRYETVPNYKT